jgi:drug/metabolite transporter (DMT)-like permease
MTDEIGLRKTMGRNDKNNVLIGCLCALGCEVLFGLSYAFTKQATGEASALALLGWRFLMAFAVMKSSSPREW